MDLFSDKLIEILKHDNEKLLRTFLTRELDTHRAQTINELMDVVHQIEGRKRLQIMEILMEDGQSDLLPLFVETIKVERNILFAKSLLFIYSNFEDSKALDALLPLESQLTGELKAAFQRVAGKLKAKFRQKFYMAEFHDGVKNVKRMKHAASMMVKEPHSDYVPFLNGEILLEEPHYRELGVQTLAQIGDASSLEALFKLMPRLMSEIERLRSLIDFLLDKKHAKIRKLKDYLTALAKLAGWEDAPLDEMGEQILSEDFGPTLDRIREAFDVNSVALWDEVQRFMQLVLTGQPAGETPRRRLAQGFDTWVGGARGLLESLFSAMGEIGHREKVDGLLQRVDAYLDPDDPAREPCMAAFLGGYRSGDALTTLIGYLSSGKNPRFLEKVLDALYHYDLDEIPEQVAVFAENCDEKSVRIKALELLAKHGFDDTTLDRLLKNESISVRADTVRTVAEHKIELGYERLVAMLDDHKLPASLAEIVIEAMAAFPREETGRALRDYILPPHSYTLRNAALHTVFEAGGEHRLGVIFEVIDQYPDKKRSEVITSFLRLLTPLEARQFPPHLLSHRESWLGILNDEHHDKFRMQVLEILENAEWPVCAERTEWIQTLNQARDTIDSVRTYDEKRKLRLLIHRIRNAEESAAKTKVEEPEPAPSITPRKKVDLAPLVDKLESTAHHEQVRAIRQLNLVFKPDMLIGEEALAQRLVDGVIHFLDTNEGAHEIQRVGFAVAGKIGGSKLESRLTEYAEELTGKTQRFAQAALALTHNEKAFAQPIRSVFVLDDSKIFTKALQRFLDKAGFQVTCANDPEAALQDISSDAHDLVILDYHMPKLNGVEFLQKARESKRAPHHVIFITTSREKNDLNHIISANVNALLLKPFPVEKLLDKIKEIG